MRFTLPTQAIQVFALLVLIAGCGSDRMVKVNFITGLEKPKKFTNLMEKFSTPPNLKRLALGNTACVQPPAMLAQTDSSSGTTQYLQTKLIPMTTDLTPSIQNYVSTHSGSFPQEADIVSFLGDVTLFGDELTLTVPLGQTVNVLFSTFYNTYPQTVTGDPTSPCAGATSIDGQSFEWNTAVAAGQTTFVAGENQTVAIPVYFSRSVGKFIQDQNHIDFAYVSFNKPTISSISVLNQFTYTWVEGVPVGPHWHIIGMNVEMPVGSGHIYPLFNSSVPAQLKNFPIELEPIASHSLPGQTSPVTQTGFILPAIYPQKFTVYYDNQDPQTQILNSPDCTNYTNITPLIDPATSQFFRTCAAVVLRSDWQ